ncbi:hypothetical protein [Acetobacter oeni]|uniref:hypothetical protein n=1 Tax=Acetobacter oeni TaxID=304077 RepID=UPI00178FC69E|nr:hypothetical protein [Acetobacter oeni]MBB3881883.1 hypothetical protein [Acetobacter oeni]
MSLGGKTIDASAVVHLVLPMAAATAFTTIRNLVDGPDRKSAIDYRKGSGWFFPGRFPAGDSS